MTGPFFQELGENGRTCNTCHVVDQGWTISAAKVQERFDKSDGLDPLFRTVDGTNCRNDDMSNLDARRAATGLVRFRGLIRIPRPLPANAEFTLSAVRDTHNCVAKGDPPEELRLYRRPLPSTNIKFITTVMWDGRESAPGQTLLQNLKTQARNATSIHAEGTQPLTDAQAEQIADFQLALFTAQSSDVSAGSLTAQGATGGPVFLAEQEFFIGINDFLGQDFDAKAFKIFDPWANLTPDQITPAQAAILRGQAIFTSPGRIGITGVNGLNDLSGKEVIFGSCSTCHSSPNLGHRSRHLLLNIGTADDNVRIFTPDIPLYTLSCPGNVVHRTTDPGLAMTTGKCADIGKFKVPILRGLAARAPYFHDGQALTLDQVLTFYCLRFGFCVGGQERDDLIAFLSSL